MASTSTADHEAGNELTNASYGIAPPGATTSATSSTQTLFSSCFQCFSFFLSLCSKQSDSMASTSTISQKPENEHTNAFEGIASSPSTSATSSTLVRKLPFDVFINHRGPDVKHTLATTLYNTLNHMRLAVFLDSEELELGDFLPKAIQDAMQSASLHIAIFSKKYAESPWCLAELSFMLKTGTTIVPVFYHVQPADLRWVEKGVYAHAFSEHEKKGRYSSEKLQEWKNALYNVSLNSGQIINNNDDERMLLKNIVNCVLKIIKKVPLVVAKHPVGLDETVKDFEMTTLQSAQSPYNVQIVGIWGMGGSGKTTLAKEIYNNKCTSMERSSFLFDVREAATKGVLHNMQKKLLEDLGVKDVSFYSMEEGKGILSRRLRSVPLFLVLDDVDHVDQLDALLPAKEILGSGSLIIVTTRELEVLRCWGISAIYKMRLLDPSYAEQLFCWHAFLQPFPLNGFEKLVKKFLDACNGLPLSLKVFGGQLYGNSRKEYWESQLHKHSRILAKDVKQRLRLSYDALDDEEKEIFLDTACFFIGEENNLAIEIWNGSGWSGLHSLEKLVNVCLVELDEKNRIRMHDHLRDLGREIASQQSPHRLWCPEQIVNVQNQPQNGIGIRGLMATTAGSTSEFDGGVCGLAASSLGLKFFVVRGQYFNQVIGKLVSRELAWLRCTETGQRILPSSLSLKNLRVLQLYEEENWWVKEHHLEELWEADGDAPMQLRELVVSNCEKFQGFPKSIGLLKHLKKIVLINGIEVRSLPQEFCLLQSLDHLQLKGCTKLSSLPSRFGYLKNLRHLDLKGCEKLRTLPDTFKQLALLHHLNFEQCSELFFKFDILENMKKLQYLSFRGCSQLEVFPHHIINQASLGELDLNGTGLREVPISIGELSKLRVMEIGSPLLRSLPTSLGNLYSLTKLSITNCRKLKSLPDSLGRLNLLEKLSIISCPRLESLPDSLGRLNLLEDLCLFSLGVKSLPKSVRQLVNLQTLRIYTCPISELDFGQVSFTSSLCNLKNFYLIETEVSKISISEGCCPGLEYLHLELNHHFKEIEALPTTVKLLKLGKCKMVKNIRSIGGLVNLQKLSIHSCPALEELPSFAKLTSLKEFEIQGCYKVEKIGVEHCRSLEYLRADTSWEVSGIESLEHLENLGRLQLRIYKRSVVEHCIQTLQKWPGEIIICTRPVPYVTSLINLFPFPNLSIVDSFANEKFDSFQGKWLQHPSNADATMVCLVINCLSSAIETTELTIESDGGGRIYEIELEEGKLVWIGVFTQGSAWLASTKYKIYLKQWDWRFKFVELQKGLLAMGSEKSVVEAFHKLLPLL